MKQGIFKKSLFLIAVILLLISVQGCKAPADKNSRAETEIDSLSSLFVPDQRMGICKINLKQSSGNTLVLYGETTSPAARTAIIKTLDKHVNNLTDSIIILPDTIANNKYMGLATLSVINLRKHPEHSAELVSQALLGTPVMIIKRKEGWLLIQTPDHYLGWAEVASVVPMDLSGFKRWQHSDRVICLINSGWIYSSPAKKDIVGDIVSGCILEKVGEEHGFTRVSLPDGRMGYVEDRSVTDFNKWKVNIRCTGESIVTSASSFIGLPYLWGGSSSKAVDCSGFSKTIYFLNGIILSRDASQQALHGKDVDISTDFSKLMPGDLLFYGSRKNSHSHVTHVAVYIGDSEYINSSGRVMINSLDSSSDKYNSTRESSLLGAKRIIGIENDPGIVPVNSHPWY